MLSLLPPKAPANFREYKMGMLETNGLKIPVVYHR